MSEETIKCPKCGTENTSNAKYCYACKQPIEKEKVNDNEVQQEKAEDILETENENNLDVIICPNCKNKLSKENSFCNKCGIKLLQEPPKCPNCGLEYTKEEDIFCKACGQKLQELNKNLDNTIQETKIFYCPNCGSETKSDETFCGECGTKLSQTKQIKKETENNFSNQKLTITVNSNDTTYDNNYNLRKCKYCGSSINKYSEKCPHCGEWQKVSHFGCGGFLVIVCTIIAICLSIGGESIGIPLIGEIGGIWLVITAFLYFLPALIAELRGHDSKTLIFVINLLFGWTLIGWLIVLIISFTGRSR